MKHIRLNTRFMALEGIPYLATLGTALFLVYAFMAGLVHGIISYIFCTTVLLSCLWSIAYGEYEESKAKGKVSNPRFALKIIATIAFVVLLFKLYFITNIE